MAAKLIGLTGGIGSGKTTIANIFRKNGVPVYIADDEAKIILNSKEVVEAVSEAFGSGVLKDGVPDRAKLASIVFNDAEKLKILNGIIHPRVAKHFEQWLTKYNDKKFVIREAAILFESGSYVDCDKIILVTAPLEIRIKRVMERDDMPREMVLERINAQWDDEKKAAMSDFIIVNIDIEKSEKDSLEILKILNKIEK